MQATGIVNNFSLHILVRAAWGFLHAVGLHFKIDLCAVVRAAVYIQLFRFLVRIGRRYLIAADNNIFHMPSNHGRNQVDQRRF